MRTKIPNSKLNSCGAVALRVLPVMKRKKKKNRLRITCCSGTESLKSDAAGK